MAIKIIGEVQSTFEFPSGSLYKASTSSYVRIEYFKIHPYKGEVEYNPIIWKSQEGATGSRITYYTEPIDINGDMLYLQNLVYVSGSYSSSFEIPDLCVIPLTQSGFITQSHYTESITSESVDRISFDGDGNEIIETQWYYGTSSILYSQSLQAVDLINLDNVNNLYSFCYNDLKSRLQEAIPSSNVIDE